MYFVIVNKYRKNTENNHVFVSWCFWIPQQDVVHTSSRTGREYKPA